jgi:hypothetical protein
MIGGVREVVNIMSLLASMPLLGRGLLMCVKKINEFICRVPCQCVGMWPTSCCRPRPWRGMMTARVTFPMPSHPCSLSLTFFFDTRCSFPLIDQKRRREKNMTESGMGGPGSGAL